MYKLDRAISQIRTQKELEEEKKFFLNVPLGERLRQAWYLTAMAYGIDPEDLPKMEKRLSYIGKWEDQPDRIRKLRS